MVQMLTNAPILSSIQSFGETHQSLSFKSSARLSLDADKSRDVYSGFPGIWLAKVGKSRDKICLWLVFSASLLLTEVSVIEIINHVQ